MKPWRICLTVLSICILVGGMALITLKIPPEPKPQIFTNCQIQFFEKSLDEFDLSKPYHEQSTFLVILLAKRAEINLDKRLFIIEGAEYGIPDSRFHDHSWSYNDMFMKGDLKIHLGKERGLDFTGTIFIDADKTYVYSYNKETKKFEFITVIKPIEKEEKR